jgi:hypothetical protein
VEDEGGEELWRDGDPKDEGGTQESQARAFTGKDPKADRSNRPKGRKDLGEPPFQSLADLLLSRETADDCLVGKPKDLRCTTGFNEPKPEDDLPTDRKVFKPSAVDPPHEMRGVSYLNDRKGRLFLLEGNGPTLTVGFSNLSRP